MLIHRKFAIVDRLGVVVIDVMAYTEDSRDNRGVHRTFLFHPVAQIVPRIDALRLARVACASARPPPAFRQFYIAFSKKGVITGNPEPPSQLFGGKSIDFLDSYSESELVVHQVYRMIRCEISRGHFGRLGGGKVDRYLAERIIPRSPQTGHKGGGLSVAWKVRQRHRTACHNHTDAREVRLPFRPIHAYIGHHLL